MRQFKDPDEHSLIYIRVRRVVEIETCPSNSWMDRSMTMIAIRRATTPAREPLQAPTLDVAASPRLSTDDRHGVAE
jgi:hypothetical protein